tara:strand:- start:173 stop:649 length:477 start_codon:yes stop_codon:yes gene_type:complete
MKKFISTIEIIEHYQMEVFAKDTPDAYKKTEDHIAEQEYKNWSGAGTFQGAKSKILHIKEAQPIYKTLDKVRRGNRGEEYNGEAGTIIHLINRNSSLDEIWEAQADDNEGLISGWLSRNEEAFGTIFNEDDTIVVVKMDELQETLTFLYGEGGFNAFI